MLHSSALLVRFGTCWHQGVVWAPPFVAIASIFLLHHVLLSKLQLVKLLLCCFSECWDAGCQFQLVVGVVAESLLRHTWSICLLGCRLCGFWWVSRSHVRSAVIWTGAWVRCVLPFLRIQSLLPYSCHLMNLCGSWCWSCWCWEAPLRDFKCEVLLLLLCWWHIARPPHLRVQLLLVSCFHSWSLFQAVQWEILLWPSLLKDILPSRCPHRRRCLELLLLGASLLVE